MKAYKSNQDVLALAAQDGCAAKLQAAMVENPTGTSVVMCNQRFYFTHTNKGDSGYSCFEPEGAAEHLHFLTTILPMIMGK
ncbi:MAG: hypothetical protein JZU59_16825 [Chromatium okenii]|jgi:hypothetical protein|nr:hypothetical protein [Chromatium okenii]